jgi:uncharacterized protein (DUF924 family)
MNEPISAGPTEARHVLDFWFGSPDDPKYGQVRNEWFRKDPAFDLQIRQRFGTLIDSALTGELSGWAEAAPSALAQVIVLDQFTRNSFRDTARAFAGDARALAAAQAMVTRGQDRQLIGVQRQFAYLPFEHAEDLEMQRRAVELFGQLEQQEPALAGLKEWALKHQVIIERFGRFPHRNAALGRVGTPEEIAFLQQPGSGF